jgi:IMP dehydrogenase
MTKKIITAPENTELSDAFKIMITKKIGKLPIVDKNNRIVGLYSFHDVKTLIENMEPYYNRDKEYRLRVAAAVGPYEEERAELLIKNKVDALVIDTAHGHSKGVIETVKIFKKKYGDSVDIVAGNIATAEAARALVDAGADALKVGIGPGSICTTRVVTGVGTPQISAIFNVVKEVGDEVPVIADGGIKQSGDLGKAIAAGASSIMMGSLFAGTQESPGEKIIHQGRTYVVYRGMGSLEAMKLQAGSRERYGQCDVSDEKKLVPQGIEGLVLFRGTIADLILQFIGGLCYTLGYCGSKNLQEFRTKAEFIKVSPAGIREAHPHDIKIIKDAPNYFSEN